MEAKKIIGRNGVRHATKFMLALSFVACCSPGIGAQANPFVQLVRSMADRLNTADQVALNKWDTKQPVYASQREAQVISNAAAMASEHGITAQDATDIFTDQIEANKVVQYSLLNNWGRQGTVPATPRQSLSGVIRPALDKLQISILQNVHGVAAARGNADCQILVARATEQVAQEMSLDALHLVALDRATARVCVRS